MDYKDILKELVSITAVSGFEQASAERIKGIMEGKCDEASIDSFFNVIGIRRGTGDNPKKIIITAHYDEIGFLVKSIDDKGFIKLTNMGGIDPKLLLAQEVVIHGKKDIVGIIGAKPPHLLKPEEAKKAVKLEDLSVDTGLGKEELRKIVSIGDTATLMVPLLELEGNKISSKSLDNRSGVAAMIGIMNEISGIKLKNDVFFVATTQEEVGLRGVQVSSYAIAPDAAVVIDACHGDMPECPKESIYPLGKGPAIGLGPNLHRILTGKLFKIAKDNDIPHQTDIEPDNTGTEAWALQVSRSGIPTVLVSIPLRYMHTGTETLSISDVENTVKLVKAFLTALDDGMEGIL
ncbi:MAG TPA: M42 family peptidase [Pseudobacteroides sp.]|uniref:M42 family metallopeptidase n=1 Tax=Pseudobacteroides sp. TaxID=1968840 RepID=UPI002F92CDDD